MKVCEHLEKIRRDRREDTWSPWLGENESRKSDPLEQELGWTEHRLLLCC